MRFWQILVAICLVVSAIADHVSDHEDAPVDVNYETVTRIIEALKYQSPDVTEEPNEETNESKDSSEDQAVIPENGLQKKKAYVPRYRRKPLRETVTERPAEHAFPEESCEDMESNVEITVEDEPGFVGSVRGTPGVDYPDYTEIPLTSFTCADKPVPGFYADLETSCQVFHVCYPHRRESFLCPIGTIFNQHILACDYWYSSNCSAALEYLDVEEPEAEVMEDFISNVEVEPSETPAEHSIKASEEVFIVDPEAYAPEISKPVLPEVHDVRPVYTNAQAHEIKEPVQIETPDIVSIAKFLPVKAKVLTFAAPLKMAALKTKILAKPIAVKVAAAKVLAAKGKIATIKAVPVGKLVKAAAAKALIGKTKVAIPIAKAMAAKKAMKPMKATAAAKTHPVISSLTKKQLALSVIRMMKEQKLRNLGNVASSQFYLY